LLFDLLGIAFAEEAIKSIRILSKKMQFLINKKTTIKKAW
jgi:hypothetical protein